MYLSQFIKVFGRLEGLVRFDKAHKRVFHLRFGRGRRVADRFAGLVQLGLRKFASLFELRLFERTKRSLRSVHGRRFVSLFELRVFIHAFGKGHGERCRPCRSFTVISDDMLSFHGEAIALLPGRAGSVGENLLRFF